MVTIDRHQGCFAQIHSPFKPLVSASAAVIVIYLITKDDMLALFAAIFIAGPAVLLGWWWNLPWSQNWTFRSEGTHCMKWTSKEMEAIKRKQQRLPQFVWSNGNYDKWTYQDTVYFVPYSINPHRLKESIEMINKYSHLTSIRQSVVYFIKFAGTPLILIGKTNGLAQCLAELDLEFAPQPLLLRAIIITDQADELEARLKHKYQSYGDWKGIKLPKSVRRVLRCKRDQVYCLPSKVMEASVRKHGGELFE